MNSRISKLCVIGLFIIGCALSFSAGLAHSQVVDPVILSPDSVTGSFMATASSNTDDPRIVRICLFRIDSNSPDPAAEFACLPVTSGRPATAAEDPTGVMAGEVFDIPFSTVLVAGQDQLFVARNIASDLSGELVSVDSANTGRIPAMIGAPLFLVKAP